MPQRTRTYAEILAEAEKKAGILSSSEIEALKLRLKADLTELGQKWAVLPIGAPVGVVEIDELLRAFLSEKAYKDFAVEARNLYESFFGGQLLGDVKVGATGSIYDVAVLWRSNKLIVTYTAVLEVGGLRFDGGIRKVR